MAMNNVQIQGRVAFVNYKAAEGDKKAFISFAVSYNTGKKENPTDQYNKEELYRCKAWGGTADFINNYFPERSQILVNASLSIGQDFTNNSGELVKGGVELLVKDAHFCGGNGQTEGHGTTAPTAPTQAPKAPTAPVAPAVPKGPAVTPKPAAKPAIKPIMPRR